VTVVVFAIPSRKKRSTSRDPADHGRGCHLDPPPLQRPLEGQGRVATLREAEGEQLVAAPDPQAPQRVTRGREQVDGRRRLGGGVEVAVARHGRFAHAEVVGAT
jgi:hypothetical protein